jgi:hypothetical protein
MNTQTQEALELAKETLIFEHTGVGRPRDIDAVITKIEQALEAAQVCQAQELSITMQKDPLAEQHPELYRQNWNAKHPDMQQPAQEPVCWIKVENRFASIGFNYKASWLKKDGYMPVYANPAQPWQGNKEFVTLTDDEVDDLLFDDFGVDIDEWFNYARAIEQALKDKNDH